MIYRIGSNVGCLNRAVLNDDIGGRAGWIYALRTMQQVVMALVAMRYVAPRAFWTTSGIVHTVETGKATREILCDLRSAIWSGVDELRAHGQQVSIMAQHTLHRVVRYCTNVQMMTIAP
ncbi:hypothetical protein M513_12143 [Trichuris suis]|uniref:Uncharacterized protein n=1 Tax=Trichuris suis TaxID=68888 RepID=A0A085LPQ7_9BILA|nr:hypothetical protein M513_12143 [Trichuris suis]